MLPVASKLTLLVNGAANIVLTMFVLIIKLLLGALACSIRLAVFNVIPPIVRFEPLGPAVPKFKSPEVAELVTLTFTAPTLPTDHEPLTLRLLVLV